MCSWQERMNYSPGRMVNIGNASEAGGQISSIWVHCGIQQIGSEHCVHLAGR